MDQNQMLNTASLIQNYQGDAVDPTQQMVGPTSFAYDQYRRRNGAVGTMQSQRSMGGAGPLSPLNQHLQQAKAQPASDPYAIEGTGTLVQEQTYHPQQPAQPNAAADKTAAQQAAWAALNGQSSAILPAQNNAPADAIPPVTHSGNERSAADFPEQRSNALAAARAARMGVLPQPGQADAGGEFGGARAGGAHDTEIIRGTNRSVYSTATGTEQAETPANTGNTGLNFSDDERGLMNAVQTAGGSPMDALHMVINQRNRAAEMNRPGRDNTGDQQAKGFLEFQKHSLAAANSAFESSRKSLMNRVGDPDALTPQELSDPSTAKLFSAYQSAQQQKQAATDGVTQAYTHLGWNKLPDATSNPVQTPRLPLGPDSIPQPYVHGMKLHAGQMIQTTKGVFRVASVDADGNPQFESVGQ